MPASLIASTQTGARPVYWICAALADRCCIWNHGGGITLGADLQKTARSLTALQ